MIKYLYTKGGDFMLDWLYEHWYTIILFVVSFTYGIVMQVKRNKSKGIQTTLTDALNVVREIIANKDDNELFACDNENMTQSEKILCVVDKVLNINKGEEDMQTINADIPQTASINKLTQIQTLKSQIEFKQGELKNLQAELQGVYASLTKEELLDILVSRG